MDWIKVLKSDEDYAISELYRLYRGEALSWMRKNYQLDEIACLDIFQESIIQLYHNVLSNKLTKLNSSVKSYLFGICKLKIKEYKRLHPKYSELSDISSSKLFLDHQIDEKRNAIQEKNENRMIAVKKHLTNLGNPCKTILELYYFKGKNMSEITEILGYNNANTTKNQKYKCIKRLQSLINLHKR